MSHGLPLSIAKADSLALRQRFKDRLPPRMLQEGARAKPRLYQLGKFWVCAIIYGSGTHPVTFHGRTPRTAWRQWCDWHVYRTKFPNGFR